jgi:hypothetical protein
MAVTTGSTRPRPPLPAGRLREQLDLVRLAPTLFALLNGLAFVLVRPDVNDLWAARARASAVEHGVGLTYWFSWFGGGTTPGNYSVLTPYTSAAVGTEMLGALSAVVSTALATLAVRDTRFPLAAAWVAAIGAAMNTWSGRVPFLFGSAFAIGALLAVRARRTVPAVALTVVGILASPVSGAFICLGLSGTFLTTRTRGYRPVIAWTAGAALVSLIGVAVLFGNPGPEPYSIGQLVEAGLGLLWLWYFARPVDHINTTTAVSVLTLLVLFAVPNGMGSNINRFVYFCLPVVALATSTRRLRVAVLAVLPAVIMGTVATAIDLVNASRPVSSVGYYKSLADRLGKIGDLKQYRVEVVNHGAHAGYDALLDTALLARGWETQEDNALNGSLLQKNLDAVTYKVWLDNNAVGYVALPSSAVQSYPEFTLVQRHRPKYLHRIWSNADWQLFQVRPATPLVARPASVVGHDQKSMTIRVPCACTVAVRVRWSKFLTATRQVAGRKPGRLADAVPRVLARVADDGSGWTTVSTKQAGTYVLRGSLRGGLLH